MRTVRLPQERKFPAEGNVIRCFAPHDSLQQKCGNLIENHSIAPRSAALSAILPARFFAKVEISGKGWVETGSRMTASRAISSEL